jgi:hypothetical protein
MNFRLTSGRCVDRGPDPDSDSPESRSEYLARSGVPNRRHPSGRHFGAGKIKSASFQSEAIFVNMKAIDENHNV